MMLLDVRRRLDLGRKIKRQTGLISTALTRWCRLRWPSCVEIAGQARGAPRRPCTSAIPLVPAVRPRPAFRPIEAFTAAIRYVR
jgi:hypothetical protein